MTLPASKLFLLRPPGGLIQSLAAWDSVSGPTAAIRRLADASANHLRKFPGPGPVGTANAK
jgi:hypothetical protein